MDAMLLANTVCDRVTEPLNHSLLWERCTCPAAAEEPLWKATAVFGLLDSSSPGLFEAF